jgi:hypothetical protein
MTRIASTRTSPRLDFIGVPAFLKQVLGRYRCEAWLSRAAAAAYDRERFFVLDLERSPSQVDPAKVEVDDYYDQGGGTTLGPEWPNPARGDGAGHATEAAVYLVDRVFQQAVGAGLIDAEDAGPETFRHQIRMYLEPDRPRYYGFLSRLRKVDGTIALFEVFQAEELVDRPGRQLWVELDQPDQCDGLDDQTPRPGELMPLFLSWDFAARNNLMGIKYPRGLGDGFAFTNR